jgi:hypothetical protein
MKAYKLRNGNLLVPKRATAENIIGDGMIEIDKKHPDYKKWLPFAVPVEDEKDSNA